jgi:ABC-type transporter Mla MlaB component
MSFVRNNLTGMAHSSIRRGTAFANGLLSRSTKRGSRMLRITHVDDQASAQTLKLEGKLLEAWIPEFLSLCAAVEGNGRPIRLDLSELFYVDQAGASLLKNLVEQGYAVFSCSNFIAELLHLENS